MSSKAKQIKTRYEKGYVTDTQLTRYMELGVITAEEYEEIYNTRHMEDNYETVTKEGTV